MNTHDTPLVTVEELDGLQGGSQTDATSNCGSTLSTFSCPGLSLGTAMCGTA